MLTLITSQPATRFQKAKAFVQRKPWLTVGLLIVLVLLVFLAFRLLKPTPADNTAAAKPTQASAEQRAALTVTSAQVFQTRLPIKLTANGNLAARQEAVLGAEVNGLRIEQINANVGDWVEAGKVLVQFAADTVRAEVAQAQAGVNEAHANAIEASANAKRARGLQDSGAMSAQQISQFLATEQTALARLESAKAALNVQQVRLKQTTLTAPDSGLITARNANLGAVVSPSTELFRMIRRGQLEWRAEVTASELARIKAGTPVQIKTNSGQTVSAQVRMVGPSVDTQSRNALVYVDVNSHPELKAGMFVRGDIDLGSQQVLALPYTAVLMRDGFNYVMVLQGVEAKTKVRLQKIEIGQRANSGEQEVVEVRSGLSAGAAVVAKGAAFLSDGDTVSVVASVTGSVNANATVAPGVKKP
jgi:HlyD family secretion protein